MSRRTQKPADADAADAPAGPSAPPGAGGESPPAWWVYVLRCADGTLYTGIARDLARRLAAHQRGSASRYTRARLPVRLVYAEPARDRSAASRREAAVKRLPRREKWRLIRATSPRGDARRNAAPPSPAPGARLP